MKIINQQFQDQLKVVSQFYYLLSILLIVIFSFQFTIIHAQDASCDPAFEEGTGNFNNAVCLPQTNAQARNNRGFLVGCENDASCNVQATPPDPLPDPIFDCPIEQVVYAEPVINPLVFTSYWNNGISTIGESADADDFATIGAPNQGFINQLFCEEDGFGLPSAPTSVGTPLTAQSSLVGTGAEAIAFAAANGETAIANETELVQSDFWIVIPNTVTSVGFQISGGAADAGLFMIGSDLNNMCASAEAFCLDGPCNQQGITEAYYPTSSGVSTTANCDFSTLRVRTYFTDLASGFNVNPLIDIGNGFQTVDSATGVIVLPATSADDNTPPTVPLGPEITGVLDQNGNIYDANFNLVPLACPIEIIPGAACDCDAAAASDRSICEILATDPMSPLGALDCDGGGIDNLTECFGPGGPIEDPNNPGLFIPSDPTYTPLDPADPADDSCENVIALGLDLCALLTSNPSSLIATEDCDNGGVDNFTECFGLEATIDPNTGEVIPEAGFAALNPLDPADDETLPIELLFFNAEINGLDGLLTWATAVEQNNSHFEIERSLDGLDFRTIGIIESLSENGNSQSELQYHYLDKEAARLNTSIYYRVKQVDHDGSFAYTPVRFITFEEVVGLGTVLFPNPIVNNQNVNVLGDAISTVHVYNQIGELVNVIEENEPQRSTSIPTSGLTKGLYFVVINNDKTIKLFIQ